MRRCLYCGGEVRLPACYRVCLNCMLDVDIPAEVLISAGLNAKPPATPDGEGCKEGERDGK